MELVSIDFIGRLTTTSKENDYCMMVVDHFDKQSMMIPHQKIISVQQAKKRFFQKVWEYFGLPSSTISHYFWQALWGVMNTTLYTI